MILRLWTTRAAKAFAVLSAAGLLKARGRGMPAPVLVDIGARGGLQRKWRAFRKLAPLRPVLIEADADEAARLREKVPQAAVVSAALGEQAGPATLYITSDPGCSSLLPPASESQAMPDLAYRLQVMRTVSLTLERADQVFAREGLPQPDFLKIDTQGSELSILKGFGALLDGVVALEVECEFLALYQGQPLISDVAAWLRERGFALEAIRPNGLYEHGLLDGNAFFVRRKEFLDARQKLLAEVWRRLNRIPTHTAYVINSD